MSFSIQIKGAEGMVELLSPDIKTMINSTIKEASMFLDNKATDLLDQRIYKGNDPSPDYTRTGNALGGHLLTRIGKGVKVKFDSRIDGASKNYTPFLNRNKRIPKFASKFWDDSIDETKKEATQIMREKLSTAFKSKLK